MIPLLKQLQVRNLLKYDSAGDDCGKRRYRQKVGCTASNPITILLRGRLNVVECNNSLVKIAGHFEKPKSYQCSE
jgi:hypothetical protein